MSDEMAQELPSDLFNEIVFEHDGLRIETRREALIKIESDRMPGCRFWYDESDSDELMEIIDTKFGADSDEASEACLAGLVITYSDGNVEYVGDAYTSTTLGAYIGYTIGRYAAAHAVPHGRVMLLLVRMHHVLENERHFR